MSLRASPERAQLVVLQSCRFATSPERRPSWLSRCQDSVRSWATERGYDYLLEGDELFSRNPQWLNEKLQGRGPIKSDVARLIWLRESLQRYERALWLDADVLIFSPERFKPSARLDQLKALRPSGSLSQGGALFGLERWVQPHKKGLTFGWRVYQNVCNALCLFERGEPYLDFYLHSALELIARVDPDFIAPQIIGPKLLTAQNNLTPLGKTSLLGSASLDLLVDLSEGGGPALATLLKRLDEDPAEERCAALNLCASLVGRRSASGVQLDEARLERAISTLLERGL